MFSETTAVNAEYLAADSTVNRTAFTWWFWIKAGIGFSAGASIVGFIAMVLWAQVLFPLYLRLALRGF
jgi:hypothetical protein